MTSNNLKGKPWLVYFESWGQVSIYASKKMNKQIIYTHTECVWKVTRLVSQTIYFNSKQHTIWFLLQSNSPQV